MAALMRCINLSVKKRQRRDEKSAIDLFYLLSVVVAAVITSGCAETKMYTTKVISIPPGARIEIDEDYIGNAPVDIQLEGSASERLFTRNHLITATNSDRRSQTKWFKGEDDPRLRDWADPIPKTILFDFGEPKKELPLKTYITKVISEPPGARIEVNGEYIGKSPLELEWKSRTGYFTEEVVIRALPIHPGQYIHERIFNPSSPIPKTVLFDMSIVSPGKPYRPDLEQEQEIGDQGKNDAGVQRNM